MSLGREAADSSHATGTHYTNPQFLQLQPPTGQCRLHYFLAACAVAASARISSNSGRRVKGSMRRNVNQGWDMTCAMRSSVHDSHLSLGAEIDRPVRLNESSDARNTASSAGTSRGVPPSPVSRRRRIRCSKSPALSPAARTESCSLVFTAPGAMALTWMLNSLTSSANVSVSRTTAVLETPYAVKRLRGEVAPPPEKLMILPRPARIMCGKTAWQRRKEPNRFTEKVFTHSCASISQTRPIGPYVPAAFTRISM